MRSGAGAALAAPILALSILVPAARASLLADSVSVAGDSISRGFDANVSSCNYGDNVSRNWATGDDHGTVPCATGPSGTFSLAERLECEKGADVANFNDAASGATMVGDFASQATNIKLHLVASNGPRFVPVFLGHNDACTNTTSKTGNGCSGDDDPNNYCRTTNAAFEREFRRGMDQLIQVPSARVLVLAPVRVSELCNFKNKDSCGVGFELSCNQIWQTVQIFGSGGICASLTEDCSPQRRIDMYDTLVGYNEILARVSAEYAAIPAGGLSATGAVKAPDVAIRYRDGTFHFKFGSDDLSCCDCFHPSDLGQAKLAEFVWSGLQCDPLVPCCAPSSDPLVNADCSAIDNISFFPGGFWPGGVACGNGIVDPGEQCDDGNTTSGDCCSSTCQREPAGQACTSDGNVCTTDACDASGTCAHVPNASPCNDGSACTHTDVCQGGACVGTDAVVCTASDQCHQVGTCNPATGVCSNPPKPDGSGCNDGNACTQTDLCDSGICTGTNAVVCSTQDQCHLAGSCNSATGVCSNPVRPNNSACDDGNPCTRTDTCQAGVCVGANPIVCTASDQCHDAGACDSATGTCTNPSKPDGVTCNDGNACTRSDTCQGGACTGANPVVCTAADQCHVAGTCNTSSGLCSNPAKPDGSACSDGNGCTQTDICVGGFCAGTNPVVCAAPDQCHLAGTCDQSTGVCSNPQKPDGTACNDGNFCTLYDTCHAGSCTGQAVVCTPRDQCHDAGTCNPATGFCPDPIKVDGSSCSDGNACTQNDTCRAGTCTSGPAVVCTALDQCHDPGTCDPATGACTNPVRPDGTACDDGATCTLADRCVGGACTGDTNCGDGAVEGACGEQCDDGPGNGSDGCCSGTCTLVDGDGDGLCDRDDPCTSGPTAAPAKLVVVRAGSPPGDEKLTLRATVQLPFPYSPPLDPAANGARVLIDRAGGGMLDVIIPAGAYVNPPGIGWRVNGTGTKWSWFDRSVTPPGGITRVQIQDQSRTRPGLVKFQVRGTGSYPLSAGDLPLSAVLVLDPPTARSGQCAEIRFPGPRPAPTCVFNSAGTTLRCR